MLRLLRREASAAREHAEEAMKISREQGFTHLGSVVTMLHGRALAEFGEPESGATVIAQGLSACRETGALLLQPYGLALLAESYKNTKRRPKGLLSIEEALAIVRKTGERWYEAELYRLKGELLLQQVSFQPSE